MAEGYQHIIRAEQTGETPNGDPVCEFHIELSDGRKLPLGSMSCEPSETSEAFVDRILARSEELLDMVAILVCAPPRELFK